MTSGPHTCAGRPPGAPPRRPWHRGGRHLGHFVGARLHRRLFLVMGLTIFLTLLTAAAIVHLSSPGAQLGRSKANIEAFVARRFAEVWAEPARRRGLAEEMARAFDLRLTLRSSGGAIEPIQGGCASPWLRLEVQSARGEPLLGTIDVCGSSLEPKTRLRFLWILFASGVVLWLGSGLIARRIGRPLWQLAQVTSRIGHGELGARVRLGRHHQGEVGMLAQAINEMAERIEKQLSDQRQLLAGVSHEIRSPLARLRVILEMLRGRSESSRLFDEAEREILEVDDLTSRLLASSRLEFVALDKRTLDAGELCRDALHRQGLDAQLLRVEGQDTHFEGDATLVSRAILNLLQNAETHGHGVAGLSIRSSADQKLIFRVTDTGEGISPADLERVFAPFVQGSGPSPARAGGTLGLGLALVKRIARAHGGDVAVGKDGQNAFFVEFWLPLPT